MKKVISIPPNYFYLCAILYVILPIVLPGYKIVPSPFDLTGIILIIAGIYFVTDSMYLRYISA